MYFFHKDKHTFLVIKTNNILTTFHHFEQYNKYEIATDKLCYLKIENLPVYNLFECLLKNYGSFFDVVQGYRSISEQ